MEEVNKIYFYAEYSDETEHNVICDENAPKDAFLMLSKQCVGKYILNMYDDHDEVHYNLHEGGWIVKDPMELAALVSAEKLESTVNKSIQRILRSYGVAEPLTVKKVDNNIHVINGDTNEVLKKFSFNISFEEIKPKKHEWTNFKCKNCNKDFFEVENPQDFCGE